VPESYKFEVVETFGEKSELSPDTLYLPVKSRELSPVERAKTFVLEEQLKAKQQAIRRRNDSTLNQDLSHEFPSNDHSLANTKTDSDEVVEMVAAKRFSSQRSSNVSFVKPSYSEKTVKTQESTRRISTS
jgi:hypothetical protein